MSSKKKGKSLTETLSKKDPEFLKFLQKQNSKLLDFDFEDDDEAEDVEDEDVEAGTDDDSDADDDDEAEEDENKSDEEMGSDDEEMTTDENESNAEDKKDEDKTSLNEEEIEFSGSDEEMDTAELASKDEENEAGSTEDQLTRILVKKSMVNEWIKLLRDDSIDGLKELVEAFKAAVMQTGNAQNIKSKYHVKGAVVSNAVVNACMVELVPMMLRVLNLPESKDPNKITLPSAKNKSWKKIKGPVEEYLRALLQYLSSVASTDLKEMVMKHLHQIVVFYSCFLKLSKVAMENMILLWSTEEETIRVIALGCIIRLIVHAPPKLVEKSLTQMYTEYCKNCKFTTAKTLPVINYMKMSLVEIMALKPDVAYSRAFVSLKGLAKKLQSLSYGHKKGSKDKTKEKDKDKKRGGKKGKKEKQENIPAIYNWQYVNSLSFWMSLICQLKSNSQVQQLIHPVVELVIGTLRVSSSAQYYPLRFTCIRMLIQLCEAAEAMTFIPVLPFVTEVLDYTPLHKLAKQSNMKICDFDTSLRMSKAELHEKVFLDGLVDQVFELVLRYTSCFSHTIGFPELVLPSVLQIKKFVKTCRVPSHTNKMKTLLQKLEDHSNQITKKRQSANFDLRDFNAVESWERSVKQEKSPLTSYYESWKKKDLEKKAMLYSDKEKIEKRVETKWVEKGPRQATKEEREKFPELFNFSSSDEEENSSSNDAKESEDEDDDEEDMEHEESVDEDNSESEDDDDNEDDDD